jgi:hypothetical protein
LPDASRISGRILQNVNQQGGAFGEIRRDICEHLEELLFPRDQSHEAVTPEM